MKDMFRSWYGVMIERNKKIPLNKGDAVKTRDNYLEKSNGYIKPTHLNDDKLYRQMFALEIAKDGSFIGVKVQSGGKCSVVNKSKQLEKYNAILMSKDDKGENIHLGNKFARDKKKYGITETDANNILKNALNHPNKNIRKENAKKLKDFRKK